MPSTAWDQSKEQDQLKECLWNLRHAMVNASGYHRNSVVALSCPQIGIHRRAFAMVDPIGWSQSPSLKYKHFLNFVNPKVIEKATKTKLQWEACLSLPSYDRHTNARE